MQRKWAHQKEIVLNEDHALIELTQGEWAIVDLDDVERVSRYSWVLARFSYGDYAQCGELKKRLHQFIMVDPPFGLVIDHINNNGLDNRKINLRFVTRQINSLNLKVPGSGITYVARQSKPWQVQIVRKRKRHYFGCYKTKEEALAVAEAARENLDR